MIRIGIDNGSFLKGNNDQTLLSIGKDGKLVFHGKTCICRGSIINVSLGILEISKNFNANAFLIISCEKHIKFGNNVLIGIVLS